MAPASIRTSAPGKLMVMGEHAVVYGRPAIVAAVNQRINVTLSPRRDDRIRVSSALGHHETTLAELTPDTNSRFVVGVLQAWQDRLPGGCDLVLEADFTSQVGLGSSAAATAAVLGAVAAWCDLKTSPAALLETGLSVIRRVQGSGSGADLAASLYGGVLLYQCEPLSTVRLADSLPLTVVYSGKKARTPEVIALVNARRDRHPELIETIFDAMGTSSREAAAAIQASDWPRLGELCDINQGLLAALGVSTPTLETLAGTLRRSTGIHGVKLSGAGRGDCLIGIGSLPAVSPPVAPPGDVLDLAVTGTGLRVES